MQRPQSFAGDETNDQRMDECLVTGWDASTFFGGRIKAVARQGALLQTHRSPPPQNKTTDTGQVDRYQREQAYDGTQMVCDDRAFAYRLVHRLTQRRALRKQG
jgi:hypothetical protein